MNCPSCHRPTAVLDSRLQKRTNVVRRRRTCAACKSRFTTHEAPITPERLLVERVLAMMRKAAR